MKAVALNLKMNFPEDFIKKVGIKPYYKNKKGILFNEDVRRVLRGMPDECIDIVITSPPYWGLRDYGIEPQIWGGDENCEHLWIEYKDKKHSGTSSKEWENDMSRGIRGMANWTVKSNFCQKCNAWCGCLGLEPHPNMYIDHLMIIFKEIKRVLKKTGSLYLNLGDSYCSMGIQRQDKHKYGGKSRIEDLRGRVESKYKSNWLQPKQLLGIPERFMIKMQEDGWILRNKIIWQKSNPMPSSSKDRLNNTWEYLYHFVKNRKYYYDLDAIRVPHKEVSIKRLARGVSATNKWVDGPDGQTKHTMSQPRLHRNKTFDEQYKIGGMRNAPEPNEPNAFNIAGKNPGDVIRVNEDVMLSPKYKDSEGHSNRRGLNRKLDKITIKAYKEYQSPIAKFLKANIKPHHKPLLDKEFGEHKWRHWIRTDLSGAALPGIEDWFKLKEIIGFNDIFDNKIYEVQKLNIPIFQSGRNPGDVIHLSTQSFPDAHFATFPEDLVRNPILSSSPKWICKKCGKARVRITKPSEEYAKNLGTWTRDTDRNKNLRAKIGFQAHTKKAYLTADYQTIGWTNCGCYYVDCETCKGGGKVLENGVEMACPDCFGAGINLLEPETEPGIVLDPFCGSGTVPLVAEKLGRRWIGIEIKEEYCEMAVKRLYCEEHNIKYAKNVSLKELKRQIELKY